MIKSKLLTVSLFLLVLSGCADTGTVRRVEPAECKGEFEKIASSAGRKSIPYMKRFTFLMAWNGIPVGSIEAGIEGKTIYRGREAYVVKLVTRSNRFLSRIYRVEDTYMSYVDTRDLTSLRFEADRKEGSYRKHVIVEYDFERDVAINTNLTDGSVKESPIEEDVHDPLSAVIYFMTLPLEPGKAVEITVNLNEKNYKLRAAIEGPDMVRVPGFGTFPSYQIQPYATLKGKDVRKGRARLYVSADENNYPLYGVVRIIFGKVTATLNKIEDIK